VTAAKTAPDWERIEVDYRAGSKSLREIAAEHGISHVAINKRAKRDGWERNLAAKVKAKADALVTKAEVTAAVTADTKITEAVTVEVEAQVQARIRLAHRKDIGRTRGIVMSLLAELEQQVGGETVELLERLGEILRKEDKDGQDRLNDLYQKIVSLPGRAKTMKDLGESLRVLVTLEREAFGIEAAGKGGDGKDLPVVAIRDLTGRK
jgi:hypothetical protein